MPNFITTMLGITTALISASMFTVGSVLQKKSVESSPDMRIRTLLRRKLWLLGLALGIFGGGPYALSQYFIGISYTQILMSSGLILLVGISKWFLKEIIGPLEYLGVFSIIMGIILLGLSQISSVNVTLFTPNFIRNLILFYLPLYLSSLIVLCLHKRMNDKMLALSAGIFFGCGAGFSQAGLLSIISRAWLPTIIFYTILIVNTVLGTITVNIAYQKGKAITIVPILSLGNYILPVVSGIIIFDQTFSPKVNLWIYFIPSVIITMIGILLLSRIKFSNDATTIIYDESSYSETEYPVVIIKYKDSDNS